MSVIKGAYNIHSKIWYEEPESNNPYAARAAYCSGYDVYGEMLGQARWVEMIYVLFHGEAPSKAHADVLEALAVALANPGPRDASVHAAMCGGVSGSPSAACLMAALAVGAGQLSGAREVYRIMEAWQQCGKDLRLWQGWLREPADISGGSIWPSSEHVPGFDPNGVTTSTIVKQTLACLSGLLPGGCLAWLDHEKVELEKVVGYPLTLSGVASAALIDLGFSPEQGEMLYLLLRLPGAAIHALEQRYYGYEKFPFGTIELEQV